MRRILFKTTIPFTADDWHVLGCPSFVTDPEGDQVLAAADALDAIRAYTANVARWLSRESMSTGSPHLPPRA